MRMSWTLQTRHGDKLLNCADSGLLGTQESEIPEGGGFVFELEIATCYRNSELHWETRPP